MRTKRSTSCEGELDCAPDLDSPELSVEPVFTPKFLSSIQDWIRNALEITIK